MSGELSRSMGVIYCQSKRLLRYENRSIESKTDLIMVVPEIILLIEQLYKTMEGKSKQLICLAVLEMLINNLVENEEVKESLHEFIRSDVPDIINSMVHLGNIGVKYFKKNSNCCFVRKLKNKEA